MKRLFFQDSDFLCEVIPSEKRTVDDMKVGKDIPENVVFQKVEHDSLPSPVLRRAWKLEGRSVAVDVEKAKPVAHEIRRERRERVMAYNLSVIEKAALGIPLKAGEDAAKAKTQNDTYKKQVDDLAQTEIDAATSDQEILAALDKMKSMEALQGTPMLQKIMNFLNTPIW